MKNVLLRKKVVEEKQQYQLIVSISRSLKLLSRELNRLYNEGKVPMEDYNILRTCLSHYTEYVPVDKRYKLKQEE